MKWAVFNGKMGDIWQENGRTHGSARTIGNKIKIMVYDPRIHHRKSIRLKGYDYSQEGLYFITICVQNKKLLLGEIAHPIYPDTDPQLTLNDAGKMIEKWFLKLEDKFPDIKCDIFIVMPNHVHCIIVNNGAGNPILARTNRINNSPNLDIPSIIGKTLILDESSIMDEHIGSPLGSVMQWFKTMSTNEYIRGVKTLDWKVFDGKLWQRNYWEHIIRDERSYDAIRKYIINNPRNWVVDKLR